MTFSTTTDLLPHQRPAVAKLLPTRVGALFMGMGTGKTRTAIEIARLRAGKWDRLVWFCPVSLKETIRHEWLRHTDLDAGRIHVFDDGTGDGAMPDHMRVAIVGIESMAASNRVVFAARDMLTEHSFVVVDESTYIKGHHAKRTQRITGISGRTRYRMILTGTPFTQGAVDLYAQMYFLSPKILGYRSFWSFAANHLEYERRRDKHGIERRTGRIIRSHNVDWLAAKIAPYTYQVRKDECLTLPDKLYASRICRMTEAQRALYERAKEELLLNEPLDTWQPIALFRLFTALQTIACGFWRRTDPETGERSLITVEHDRLETLDGALGGIPEGEKVIVWAKYRPAVSAIVERLATRHGADRVARFDGTLSESQRASELARFRANARFLVATQSAGSHGLTLNEAAYVIFYADGYKYSERAQAEDRNHRIGQSRTPVYISIRCAGSIDERIAAALERKENALLTFQGEIERCRGAGMKERARQMVAAL